MNVVENFVVLLKGAPEVPENDEFVIMLKNSGFTPRIIAPVIFEYSNNDLLSTALFDNTSKYLGIIFTSPRSVLAVENCFVSKNKSKSEKEADQNISAEEIVKEWQSKQNFAVGETTEKYANSHLGFSCHGQNSGSAEKLADQIVSRKDELKPNLPFLSPSSNLKSSTLKETLDKHNIKIEEIICYETKPNPNIKNEIVKLIEKGVPEFWIFFSPSGANNTIPFLVENKLIDSSSKLVAIGPTTFQALKKYNITPWCMAKKPNPVSLIEALKESKNSKQAHQL